MRWTTEEDARLRALYPSHTRAELSVLLGRPMGGIRDRCMKLGLNTKAAPHWTPEEVASLRALYEQHRGQIVPLAAWIKRYGQGRDPKNINRKARELGLTEAGRPRHRPRKPTAKWPTREAARAATGRATRERWQRQGHPKGALGMRHSQATKQHLAAASQRAWEAMTPERLQVRGMKQRTTKLERYGTAGPIFVKDDSQPFSRCKGGRRADLGGQYFRSGWEANYARYLNFLLQQRQILAWAYEPRCFVFEGVTRGPFTYTPDFCVTELDGHEVWHEIKGWMTSKSKSTLKRMAKHYPEITIRLVDETVYRALSRQCRGLIASWE